MQTDPRSLRLLQLVTSYQSVVTILASKLRMLTPETQLLVSSSFEDPRESRTCPGTFFRVDIPRTIRPLADLYATCRLARFIKAMRIDIVHTHTAKAGIVGAMAAKLAGVPVVHSYHGVPWFTGQNPLLNTLYKSIEFLFSRWRSAIFSQNRRDFDELRRSFPCPVIFEGNGVDVEEVERNAAEHVDQVRGVWPAGNLRIICVARLEPVKRVETVIECARHLKDRGISLSLVIAGRGPEEAKIRALAGRYGLEKQIAILYTPYTHALLSLADLAVLSSVKEGIPRGLMEAMALGKPVVATDVLGTNELVVNNQTGLLAALGDQEAFNTAACKLALDKELRDELGRAGRQRVLQHFNERKIVEMWLREYRKIVQ